MASHHQLKLYHLPSSRQRIQTVMLLHQLCRRTCSMVLKLVPFYHHLSLHLLPLVQLDLELQQNLANLNLLIQIMVLLRNLSFQELQLEGKRDLLLAYHQSFSMDHQPSWLPRYQY